MAKYYVTLGQNQHHMIDNRIWDKESVLQINAEDASVAENYTNKNLGKDWTMMTNEEEHRPECYPKGIIKKVNLMK